MRVKAIKEGFDGRQIRKPGEIFNFAGKKGSWMVEVDANGIPVKGEKVPEPPREVRHGMKTGGQGKSRNDLRAECKSLGIQFPATAGAQALAVLIQEFHDKSGAPSGISNENPDGGGPGVGTGDEGKGTGNQDVL